jgi:hypothetical protein
MNKYNAMVPISEPIIKNALHVLYSCLIWAETRLSKSGVDSYLHFSFHNYTIDSFCKTGLGVIFQKVTPRKILKVSLLLRVIVH